MKLISRGVAFLITLLLSSNILYSGDVQKLLNDFNHKNDLSQKTIDENKGHLVLFTRERLEKIHAKSLKDVFKTTPIIYYQENRLGLPDPLNSGALDSYQNPNC